MTHLKLILTVMAAEDAVPEDKCEAEDVPEDECEAGDVNENDKLLKPKH